MDACAPSKAGRGREITLRERAAHEAMKRNRTDQKKPEWWDFYQHRQGIEAAVSQGVRAFGLRRSRYRGHPKTRFQHLFTATAMNLARLDAWIIGTPRAGTRIFPLRTVACPRQPGAGRHRRGHLQNSAGGAAPDGPEHAGGGRPP
ncbi:transposase, partial [Streptomyces mirabilis]|uniref:transposase n=1 Tax=Streptomyces mirabilis TaxID=68239 RepID=UPI00364476C4